MKDKQSKRYKSSKHTVSRNVYWTSKAKEKFYNQSDKENDVNEDIKEGIADAGNEAADKISRQIQKKRIKRKYAEMKRQGQMEGLKDRLMAVFKTSFLYVKEYFAKNSHTVLMMMGASVILIGVMGMCSSCAAGFMSSTGTVLGTSYTAEDEEILGAEAAYCALEENLRKDIEHIEVTYPGYDEYRYELQEISHNPYELIAYLTVRFEDFKCNEVQQELLELYSKQYMIQLDEVIEIRTREEERTGYRTVIDEETGEEELEEYQYTVTVEYEYKILYVKLININLETVILNSGLSEDQIERYEILMETKGNRAYLFGDDIYSNEGEYLEYDIPGEALTDSDFAELIREAERYLGKPYVWGGSTPQTGFDCSGYVCWVLNQTGTDVGRTTANGLLNKCDIIRPSEARPGDLIFFQGTYNVSGASHVGIYVGNNMMIHCGTPISYANLSSAYWQEHFYCFGRI